MNYASRSLSNEYSSTTPLSHYNHCAEAKKLNKLSR